MYLELGGRQTGRVPGCVGGKALVGTRRRRLAVKERSWKLVSLSAVVWIMLLEQFSYRKRVSSVRDVHILKPSCLLAPSNARDDPDLVARGAGVFFDDSCSRLSVFLFDHLHEYIDRSILNSPWASK